MNSNSLPLSIVRFLYQNIICTSQISRFTHDTQQNRLLCSNKFLRLMKKCTHSTENKQSRHSRVHKAWGVKTAQYNLAQWSVNSLVYYKQHTLEISRCLQTCKNVVSCHAYQPSYTSSVSCIQNIARKMHMVCMLWCFVVAVRCSLFPAISFRVTSLASYNCPTASKVTLKNMGKWTKAKQIYYVTLYFNWYHVLFI